MSNRAFERRNKLGKLWGRKPGRTHCRFWTRSKSHASALALAIGAVPMFAIDVAVASMDEIIVTATRREESIQDVPIAVSAFDGDFIENARIQTFDDVLSLIPGAVFFDITGSNGSFPSMRGSAFTDDSPAADLPVAFFIDDVYAGSGSAFNTDFYDIEQVAVLRGPQGTTFGRNVVGGAIQITTRKPELGERSAELTVGGRNRPGFEARGFVNQPINDRLAARVSFQQRRVDGHTFNETTGNDVGEIDVWSVRAQALYQASSALDILVSGSYSRDTSKGLPRDLIIRGAQPTLLPVGPTGLALNPDPRVVNNNEDGFTDRYTWAGQIRLDWNTSWGNLVSITAGRGFEGGSAEDVAAGPLPELLGKLDFQDEAQFTQEVRLVSPSDGRAIDYVFGVFFLKASAQRTENNPFIPIPGTVLASLTPPIVGSTHQQIDTLSVAPFGELVWNATDWLALRAGVRFTYEDKEGEIEHFNDPNPFTGPVFTVPIAESWTATTPRFGLEISPTDDILLYGTISKGFKSGGWSLNNATPATAQQPFEPEEVWSYEVGVRTEWFDNRITFNGTAFLAETNDLQIRQWDGVATFLTTNAAKVEAKGVELELFAQPTDEFGFGVVYGYTDSRFDSFPNCAVGVDCDGNRVPYVPLHTATVYGQYTTPLPNLDATLSFRAEYNFNSEYRLNDLNNVATRNQTKRDAYVNAFMTYEPDHGDWSLSLWGRNILDDEAISGSSNFSIFHYSAAEIAAGNQAFRAVYDTPRQWGGSVSFRF